ncbi:LysR family transcriptional regulator [uncultured Tateyamaria sp.]|uniref:LysR family transcriptional regulator n=1 Tax=uncultured Tateyamaria sp. TaxID=455651 RepID=UPI00262A03B5|nr:LysR family transcriptional regulator [uncultured Tateyamaria sp.]
MELKWLEDFAALVRTGNFSRAAEERHVTQPAYSRRIRALEYWLGVTLFDRSSFPVQLTSAGEEFLPKAQALIADINLSRQDLRLMHAQDKTSVRIVTLHTLSISFLPPIVRDFVRENPEASISILPSVQGVEQYFEALLTGVADVLLTYDTGDTVLDVDALSQIEIRQIDADRLIPVMSPSLRATLPRDWIEAQKPIPLLAYSSFSFSDRIVQPVLPRLQCSFRKVFESPLSESLRRVALDGTGVAWLPERLVRQDLKAGSLIEMEGADLAPVVTISVYKLRATRSDLVEAAWEVLCRQSGA